MIFTDKRKQMSITVDRHKRFYVRDVEGNPKIDYIFNSRLK